MKAHGTVLMNPIDNITMSKEEAVKEIALIEQQIQSGFDRMAALSEEYNIHISWTSPSNYGQNISYYSISAIKDYVLDVDGWRPETIEYKFKGDPEKVMYGMWMSSSEFC